jgi:hypothetical protein
VSFKYDSKNTKDNESRKFQPNNLGEVSVTVSDKETHQKLDAIAQAIGAAPTNIRTLVLAAEDREQVITYEDFGTKNQRIVRIDYTTETLPDVVVRKIISYSLVGNNYRRDNIRWEVETI